MTVRKFKRNPKTEAARADLIALSQLAQSEQESLEGMAGEPLTINQILLMYYKAETGCKDFRRFDQWKEAGYKIKKGESAFRVWGSPVKAKKTANGESFEESAETAEEGSAAKKYKFWPMCCLFNESQVEPMGSDNGPDDHKKASKAEAATTFAALSQASEAPTANDPVNRLGNNESVSRNLDAEPQGKAPQSHRLAAGDPKTAAKLREIADKQTTKIADCFAERLQNTPKRRAQSARKREEGQLLKRTQAALYALAELHQAGAVPPELSHVKSLSVMKQLMAAKMEPVPNGYHTYHVETDEPANDTPETRAAWALVAPMSEDEKKTKQLEEKTGALLFANIPGYFPTPAPVADLLIDWAQIEDGHSVADTSAGSGHLLDRIVATSSVFVEAYERHHSLADVLALKGYSVITGDFLQLSPARYYDRIVINPPFEQLQDVDHVRHSFDFLKPGGRLVAVMSPGAFFRETNKALDFRAWFKSLGGLVERLPEHSFKDSGTDVSTVRVLIDKPRER